VERESLPLLRRVQVEQGGRRKGVVARKRGVFSYFSSQEKGRRGLAPRSVRGGDGGVVGDIRIFDRVQHVQHVPPLRYLKEGKRKGIGLATGEKGVTLAAILVYRGQGEEGRLSL